MRVSLGNHLWKKLNVEKKKKKERRKGDISILYVFIVFNLQFSKYFY